MNLKRKTEAREITQKWRDRLARLWLSVALTSPNGFYDFRLTLIKDAEPLLGHARVWEPLHAKSRPHSSPYCFTMLLAARAFSAF